MGQKAFAWVSVKPMFSATSSFLSALTLSRMISMVLEVESWADAGTANVTARASTASDNSLIDQSPVVEVKCRAGDVLWLYLTVQPRPSRHTVAAFLKPPGS